MNRWFAGTAAAVLLAAMVFLYWHVKGTPWMHAAAAGHAKSFIAQQYGEEEETLSVRETKYSLEAERFAVTVTGPGGEKYEAAVRMENRHETALILDVTGQFDPLGLSYCH
ncbi:hypothetical protein [Alteribacter natronophilus]|uniref:YfjL-like protein n=1 Tax=Alteribacter natronophilus TaxID=2583810 RepID=UPI00110DC0BF|nr:hypothetical protein [Alteribacter natronophilus]TMW73276.1 hypothetical protein FGB90_02895 [Alteribacter natronophilus]